MIAVIGRDAATIAAACAGVDAVECWSPATTPHDALQAALAGVALAARAWSRGDAERLIRADLAQRALLDRWAAREVRRRKPRVVIAPSLAARRTLAAAHAIGATAVLAHDLPVLRQLAADLDRAAAQWPTRRFLRRVRPAPAWVAEQESEWMLADVVLVRGGYARQLMAARGVAGSALVAMPMAAAPAMVRASTATGRIRLAGIATARHGLDSALAATRALGLTLVVRVGDATEPADLATHPGVATDDGPVDGVIAPAVCEAYPVELRAARAAGVPRVVSPLLAEPGDVIGDPYDVAALTAALATALAASAPAPIVDSVDLAAQLRRVAQRPRGGAVADVAASCAVPLPTADPHATLRR